MNRAIEISSGTILRTIFILLLLWFVFLVRDILVLVFVAVIIVSAMDPIVDWLQRKKIPRALTVLLVYILVFAIIGTGISFLVAPLSSEISNLGKNFPRFIENLSGYFTIVHDYAASHSITQEVGNFTTNFNNSLSQISSNVFSGTVSFIGGLFSFVVILSMAFYMSVQEKGVKKFFTSLVPHEHSEYIKDLIDRIQFKMGRWLLGQIALMIIIFTIDYVGLLIIGVPYALILAILAGFLEIIPYVGPIVSTVAATLIVLLNGGWIKAVLVLLLFTLAQQLEGNVITPLVMRKAVGLNPVVVIVALLIGFQLDGIVGALIAIPAATAIGEVVGDIVKGKEATGEEI
jgi:predicted PurR-regulated permease PerM